MCVMSDWLCRVRRPRLELAARLRSSCDRDARRLKSAFDIAASLQREALFCEEITADSAGDHDVGGLNIAHDAAFSGDTDAPLDSDIPLNFPADFKIS